MKMIALLTIMLSASLLHAQQFKTVDSIKQIIAGINSSKISNTLSFETNTDGLISKISYFFSAGKALNFVSISYRKDSMLHEESYYISNGKLLYSLEKDISFMPHLAGKEEMGHWNEECYFINDTLVYEISGGHGKTESGNHNPEIEVLKRFGGLKKALEKNYYYPKRQTHHLHNVFLLHLRIFKNPRCYE